MTKQLRRVLLLVPFVAVVPVAAALGAKVQAPIRGVLYAGAVHHETIALKVAKNGKTARVSLPIAPAFCRGGSSAQEQKSQASTITKTGHLTAKIAYYVRQSGRQFATVTVSGSFNGRVFRGTVNSSFTPAKSCNGQESFAAEAR